MPLAIILVVLLVRPHGLFGSPEVARSMTLKRASPDRAALRGRAVAVPFFFSSYRVGQFTLVLAYAVAVLGLNLLVGYSGQISLGHGAFFALGAYATAILIADHGFPHLATSRSRRAGRFAAGFAGRPPGAAAARALPGAGDARPRGGDAAAHQALRRPDRRRAGPERRRSPSRPAGDGLADDQWLYLLTLAIAIPLFVLAAGIVRGRVGRALVAIRDNEIAAKTMGVNLAPTRRARSPSARRTRASAARCSRSRSASSRPSRSRSRCRSRSWPRSSSAGWPPSPGAVLGALFIVFVPEYAADVNEALAGVIYGAVLIASCTWSRRGLVGMAAADRAQRTGRDKQGEPSRRVVEP